MKVETLQRALIAARAQIATADRNLSDWREMRERRRRQEAVFLRGIIRRVGSQRKAAGITGISQAVISRTLDRKAHMKNREAFHRRSDVRKQKLTSPEPTNVVPLRKRRPDWQRRQPKQSEVFKWFEQYLGWTKTAQENARQMIFNSEGRLPDAAYYPTQSKSADGDSAVGAGS